MKTRLETLEKPRIGIMGGTFDPIHNGHLSAASEAQEILGLDHVIFVPAGDPSHKKNQVVTPAEDRYLMTVIATSANPSFSVSRIDIDRKEPTYTIDTLTELRKMYPTAELFFITGADVLGEIFTWDRAEGLFELACFVGCTRPGYKLEQNEYPEPITNRIAFVDVPALAISSTAIRARARDNKPLWYLTPDGVVQYINKTGLYT